MKKTIVVLFIVFTLLLMSVGCSSPEKDAITAVNDYLNAIKEGRPTSSYKVHRELDDFVNVLAFKHLQTISNNEVDSDNGRVREIALIYDVEHTNALGMKLYGKFGFLTRYDPTSQKFKVAVWTNR